MRIATYLSSAVAGERQTLSGWIASVRHAKRLSFISLRDGSTATTAQIIVFKSSPEFEAVRVLGTGDCITVTGSVVASKGGGQAIELVLEALTLHGAAGPDFPIQKKAHTLEWLRTQPHLRARSRTLSAVFRVRSVMAQAIHAHYAQEGFHYVHTPILTSSDCEGAGEMFSVGPAGFFGDKEAFLTVSGQLEGEMLALSMGDIYTFGPTFRAEHSETSRHAAEFWMIEPEMVFCDMERLLETIWSLVTAVTASVLERCEGDLKLLDEEFGTDRLAMLRDLKAVARITYTEAIDQLKADGFEVAWGDDLSSECEKHLTAAHGPVFVTDWPLEIKSFYMRVSDDGRTVGGVDLLVPLAGELVGGSVREERHDKLLEQMAHHDIPIDEMQWYVDSRRFGSAPHAGFGIGFERFVMWVTGMKSIKDVVPYPRTYGQML